MVIKTKVEVNIRRGYRDDAPALASIGRHMFAETHLDAFTDDDLKGILDETWSVEQLKSELDDERNLFLVAQVDEAVCGLTKLSGGSPPSIEAKKAAEISRLYLDPSCIGLGVGSHLMESVIEAGSSLQYQTLWLMAWEYNHRALKFYDRWGFKVADKSVYNIGNSNPTAITMTLDI